jgi:hypothetical protein
VDCKAKISNISGENDITNITIRLSFKNVKSDPPPPLRSTWVANIHWDIQEILRLYGTQISLTRSQQPATGTYPEPDASIHIFSHYFPNIPSNIILPSTSRSSERSSFRVSNRNFVCIYHLSDGDTYPAHLILLDLITPILFVEAHKIQGKWIAGTIKQLLGGQKVKYLNTQKQVNVSAAVSCLLRHVFSEMSADWLLLTEMLCAFVRIWTEFLCINET